MDAARRNFLRGAAGSVALVGSSSFLSPAVARADGPSAPTASTMPTNTTFATIRRGGRLSLGIKTGGGILDVRKAAQQLRETVPTTIDDVLHGRGNVQGLHALVDKARSSGAADGLFLAEDEVEFGPCVTNPEKIIGVGLNYRRHAQEVKMEPPKVPLLFNKYNNSLCGHRGTIQVSAIPATKFDYEAELVIVMGKKAHAVNEGDALSYVFGYCTGNDFSARDLQFETSQIMLGKALDNFAPLGPYLVSADQVPDPNNLKISCSVNGEVRQDWTTSDMIFDCKQLIAYISKYFTLQPGDIIFTGTPQGVILGKPKEQQVWLKPGDRLVTSIEKLGDLHFSLA